MSATLSASAVAGIVVELEICNARLVRLHAAARAVADNHTIAQRVLVRITEVNKKRRKLILSLEEFTVDRQIAEAFNPGSLFSTEAADLVRGGY